MITKVEILSLVAALYTVGATWFFLVDSWSDFDKTRLMYLKVKNLFARNEVYLVKDAPVTHYMASKGELIVEEYGVVVPITCQVKISDKARRILQSNDEVTTELYIIGKIDDKELRLVSFKEFKLKQV